MLTRTVRAAGAGLVGLIMLAGCSGDAAQTAPGAPASEAGTPTEASPGDADTAVPGPEEDGQSPTPDGESPYLPVPSGVRLTPPGSDLGVGDTAILAAELPESSKVGVFEIRVDRLQRAGWEAFEGWVLPEEIRRHTPYFVRVSVRNAGRSDLGGERLPLYVVDGDNVLLQQSTFTETFQPCWPATLPEPFGRGEQTQACLVYLAPDGGELAAVSFRPDQSFNPITWSGKVSRYRTRAP